MHEVHTDLGKHIRITADDIGDMRKAIARRVHHLPFVHHVVDFLMLEAEAPLQQAVVEGIKTLMVEVVDLGIETVAGMFCHGTHLIVLNHFAKIIGAERGVADAEEILLLQVESLGLVGRIGRCDPFQAQVFMGFVRQRHRPESRCVIINLLSIEKHVDLNGDVDGACIDFGVFGDEHVTVLGIIAQDGEVPFVVELVAEQGLGIGEVGPVVALGVHHAKRQSRVLVTSAH